MPVEIYQILLETWHRENKMRPGFNKLSKIFEEVERVPAKYGLSTALKKFSNLKLELNKIELVGGRWSKLAFIDNEVLKKGTEEYKELVEESRKIKVRKLKSYKNEPEEYEITSYIHVIENDESDKFIDHEKPSIDEITTDIYGQNATYNSGVPLLRSTNV